MFSNLATVEPVCEKVLCPECADDPTCSPEDVAKDWKFQWRYLQQAGSQQSRGDWRCPWCGKENAETVEETVGSKRYSAPSYLIRHVTETHENQMSPEDYAIFKEAAAYDGGRSRKRGADLKTDLTCPDCRDDPSCSEANVRKLYNSAHSLAMHRDSNFHKPVKKSERMLAKLGAWVRGKSYTCPWCPSLSQIGNSTKTSNHIVYDVHELEEEISPDILEILKQRVAFEAGYLPGFTSPEVEAQVRDQMRQFDLHVQDRMDAMDASADIGVVDGTDLEFLSMMPMDVDMGPLAGEFEVPVDDILMDLTL